MAETNRKRTTVGLRLASMLVDHFAMTFIVAIIAMPGIALLMLSIFNVDHEPSNIGVNMGGVFFFFGLGFTVYLNKDIFNGRSIAKRMLKMQVVDNKMNLAASPLKCLVRNLTIPIWPIELIFVLVDPKRRLGDRIAGTRIDYVEYPEKIKISWRKMLAPILIGFGFAILISLPFTLLSSFNKDIPFVESSWNSEESKSINRIMETRLQGLIKKADFRIYDSIENDNRKYVAGILYLQNEADFDNFEHSENVITNLLAARLPLKSHIWFLKFVYRGNWRTSVVQKWYGK